MTFRIHRQTTAKDGVVWRVSGRITGDNVNTLKTLLEQESGPLRLDLTDVRLVDAEAVKILAMHESKGVRISNCPPYIREWITRERDTK